MALFAKPSLTVRPPIAPPRSIPRATTPPHGNNPAMAVTLADIVARRRADVDALKATTPESELHALVAQAEPPRNFFRAVTRTGATAVIAEIKRRSPSAGWIRPEYQRETFSPEPIARGYHTAGAAAISCLTEPHYFSGDLAYINRIKDAVPLPVLRKDFLIDPWQLWESRAAGADAVLLIAECLNDSELVDMLILSQQLQLTVLLEVHEMESLLRVRPYVGFPHASYALLGINNRDLSTMTTDIRHTLRLLDMVEDRSTLVSESGITTAVDLARLRAEGVRIVLVGEHLMRSADPGKALASLLGHSQTG